MPPNPEIRNASAGVTVVAIGGNALLRGGPTATIAEQFEAARTLARPLAELVAAGHRLVVTHGNGPQVGFIKRRSDLMADLAPELPSLDLDMCVADSQGSIGYILASTLAGHLKTVGHGDRVAALVTHTVVDPADPAFAHPTKPIGSFYDEETAGKLAARHGWHVTEDSGRGWRRIVPSPAPRRVVEQDAVAGLLAQGYVVIAGGGGGIPVVESPDGTYKGVEAVIDKDATSALLATVLGAGLLAVTTGVEQIAVDHGRPTQRPLARLTCSEARRHLADGQFPAGSMGPKVEAALAYLDAATTRDARVLVTSPAALAGAMRGSGGTWLVRDDAPVPPDGTR
ncbi:carbamate kinase [Streptomyces sp. NBC_01465]|uniref:carbamate kinase n=1 Tax=Streptomyces sp. NBC_01465 TaxID=2903878 RepID=UPI002E3441D5|nr:carbamate kinase [Streptomyces sp. NBC_01465]